MSRGMDSPCYTTIFRRMQKLDVDIAGNIITVRDRSNNLVMIARRHGPRQHNRGEWIRKKWKVCGHVPLLARHEDHNHSC